jgi:hypothetical protein
VQYKNLKNKLKKSKISYGHLKKYKYNFLTKKPIPLKYVLVNGSTYSTKDLKKRLIAANILKEKCYICGLTNVWNKKKLVLVFDHINGNNNDHRLKNIRLLCPNCNSQTPTFSGRNRKGIRSHNCASCKIKISRLSKYCRSCANRLVKRIRYKKVINRPNKRSIIRMTKSMSMTAIGKKYGVSDNAVRKWLK